MGHEGREGRHRRRETNDALIRVGAVIFLFGVVAIAANFLPVLILRRAQLEQPLWLNLLTMLAPVGFGVALVGLWREARRG